MSEPTKEPSKGCGVTDANCTQCGRHFYRNESSMDCSGGLCTFCFARITSPTKEPSKEAQAAALAINDAMAMRMHELSDSELATIIDTALAELRAERDAAARLGAPEWAAACDAMQQDRDSLAQENIILRAENERLQRELDSHAFDISPAMVMARNEQLNAENERLKALLYRVQNSVAGFCPICGCMAHHSDCELAKALGGKPSSCEWLLAEGHYDTGCGHAWEFTSGTLSDNDVKFCPYCGKRVLEAEAIGGAK